MTCRAAMAMLAAATVGCSGADTLPPLAEALVVVDTDMPVPRVANRLRIDLYDRNGTWFESRDIARPDPRDWPVSFSVYSDDEEADRSVWVRLRIYPEGRRRDYLGERFSDWGGPIAPPLTGSGEPRLLRDGVDITPSDEPQPLMTVDRLLRLRLQPGMRGRARVTLRAACAGTMVRLRDEPPHESPAVGQAQSCVDREKLREVVGETLLEMDNMQRPTTSLQGSDLGQGCGGPDTTERVCIPGGSSILGSAELTLVPGLEPLPERIVRHPPFWLDRHEVSVARFRAALEAGFVPTSMPVANEGPLGNGLDTSTCTFSATDRGREGHALSCINWHSARELCQFMGGDLPSEAQWEHMAELAAPAGHSRYPWGDESPTCERANYGRLSLGGSPGVCEHLGGSLDPIGAYEADDVTLQGIVGAAGGVAEWTRDTHQDYGGACWGDSPVLDPGCSVDGAERALRGGSWAAPPTILPSAVRLGANPDGEASIIGLRCAYRAEEQEP